MTHNLYIMAKIPKRSFAKYRGSAISLSCKKPHSVEEILFGVKHNPDEIRQITTFKDKEGNIIERCFDFGDGYLKNRIYQNYKTKIGKDESVNSTVIKEFKIRKRMLSTYFSLLEEFEQVHPEKTLLWTPIKVISNHFASKKDGEKILSQVKISNMETPTKEVHSFTEYPHIKNGKIEKKPAKTLKYRVNALTNSIVKNSESANGVKIPAKDTFLRFRAMDINDAIEPITRFFVKKKGLKKAEIEINPEYYPKNEDEKLYLAHFSPTNGSINFNINFRPESKTRLTGTAAHEAEHGWQYFLKALSGNAVGDWEERMFDTFGMLCDTKLLREARRYTKSIVNYIPLTKELKDSGEVKKYRENYIEKMAVKAGRKARKQYDIEGKQLRRAFPHIPEKFV